MKEFKNVFLNQLLTRFKTVARPLEVVQLLSFDFHVT
jgi:hypothetical protein